MLSIKATYKSITAMANIALAGKSQVYTEGNVHQIIDTKSQLLLADYYYWLAIWPAQPQ